MLRKIKVIVMVLFVAYFALNAAGVDFNSVDLDENGTINLKDHAILAGEWNPGVNPYIFPEGTPVLEQDFEEMTTGSIGWGAGNVSTIGGRWYLLGTWLSDPSVTTAASYTGSKSLKISCGDDGQNVGVWTLAAGIPEGMPFKFISYVNPISNGADQGAWKVYVNNYNYVQYDYSTSPSHTEKPIGWYIDTAANLFVWNGGTNNWTDTGVNCPAGQWTGIQLEVTNWNDGSGTGYYTIYTDSGSGFTIALAGVQFNSIDLKDSVNSILIEPVCSVGSATGYMDSILISSSAAPVICSDVWNVWNASKGLWPDINNDCSIDLLDLLELASQWLASEGVRVLDINWREGPEYPLGIQDSAFRIVNGKLISAGGFSRWPAPQTIMNPSNTPYWPDAFAGESSGFTKLTLMFDPANEAVGWTRITDLPSAPRQGMVSTVVSGAEMYIVGGFNYADLLTYRTSYRLQEVNGNWIWDQVATFPWNVTSASAVTIGKKIYLLCGADYFVYPGASGADFHSEAGRVKPGYPNGTPVGHALMMLDTDNMGAGWQRLADLPGTPRSSGGAAVVGNKIYVFGGMFAPSAINVTYHNVVDNWVYDVATDSWSQLVDMPINMANTTAVTYSDRYIILAGGYRYPKTKRLDGSTPLVFTSEEVQQWLDDWTFFFEDKVLVYDTLVNEFTDSDTLLDRSSTILATIDGDTIYSIGGEGGRRLWHPAIFQIGTVSETLANP